MKNLRGKPCPEKHRYHTMGEAETSAALINGSNRARRTKALRAYECNCCDGYHLTSRRPPRRPPRRRAA